jgi:hypothetical protein
MWGPCSSCIYYRVIHSMHPVESWCFVSGSLLSANDVWHNREKAHTGKFGVYTKDIPECKFTMSPREVQEWDEWKASKMTIYYRNNRGSYDSFYTNPANKYWIEQRHEEENVEMEARKRFWPVWDAKNKRLVPRVIKYDKTTNKLIHNPLQSSQEVTNDH